MITPPVAPSTYCHPNSWEHAGARLRSLERTYDPASVRRLEALGVGHGWRCLEVGAGAGSIARWLCSKAGASGRVLAVDLDTRLLADLRAPNLDVARLDLRVEELPQEAFDLVHVRAVLTHLPERDAVLEKLIGALAPRGWLLVEEADADATLGRCNGLHRRMMVHLFDCLHEAGADLRWARELPNRLATHGLADISAECEVPLLRGGSAGVGMYELTTIQMREKFLTAGATAAEIDEWVADLHDPTAWLPGIAFTAAWARRR